MTTKTKTGPAAKTGDEFKALVKAAWLDGHLSFLEAMVLIRPDILEG